jgi:hypothetical protein
MTDDPPKDPPLQPDDVPPDVAQVLDEIDFVGPPRILGNLGRTDLSATYNRDLTEADIQALNGPRGANLPRTIQKLRSSHHALARCLASGMKASQAAQVSGYTQNRISILQDDPTFAALVAEYRAEAKEIFADLNERMNNLSLDAIEELHERLLEAPEAFSIAMLLDVVKAFADRTGHGPGQEVKLTVAPSLIDRPPKETYEEWQARRARELTPEDPEGASDSLLGLVPTTRTPN